ncbi:MAG: non-ribosomal peptide synthetase [Rhodococcus sp. (in: high G+C Gram-positive bacteria)]|nr:MAG: non-ribosomal peptide synthetase [Rhodococcus sp. (in: high G+C Gram-positive bacteria)]
MLSLKNVDVEIASGARSDGHPGPRDLFALSAAQRGIWFAQHLLGELPITIAQYVEFSDLALDIDLLAEIGPVALRELGTGLLRIVEHEGEPFQMIDDSLVFEMTHLDFRHEDDPTEAAHAWMRAEYSTPIDLTADRLIHTAMLRLADDHYYWYTRIHHIALDGFGAMTFMNRAAELYTAAKEGRAPAKFQATELHEVVEDEARYRTSSRFEKDRAYWAERSREIPHPISLAGRAAAPGTPARVVGAPLPADTETALMRLTELQPGATFATVVVAAVAAFLARLTGETDVILSLPVSARTTAKLRNSGGMVSNVVPIRLLVQPEATVPGLLRMVQLELTGALRHQRYRHEDIRRDAGIGGGHRGFFGPSINIMMFHDEIRLGRSLGRLNVLTTGPVEDLTVNIYPGVAGAPAHIDFEANPHLYSGEELRGHHARFLEFLSALAQSVAHEPVAALDVLHADERASLVPCHGPAAEPARLLPDLLADGVAAAPHGAAVRASGAQIDYRDLDVLSNRLARLLIGVGAGPETFVALTMPRSAEALVAFWAITKTGAAFVPIDPALPAERIAHMLTDSGAKLGVTTADLGRSLPESVQWIALDDESVRARCDRLPGTAITDAERRAPVEIDTTAYMIYTSGSTGTPKGVLVTHRALTAFAAGARPELGVTSASRVLRFSSASFDASIFEMIQAFSAGATMVVAPPGVYGGTELVDLMRDEQITHVISASTLMNTVDPRGLDHLEAVVVGGDVCTPDLVERFGHVCRFTNTYGPTESTIVITAGDPLIPGEPITIGRPIQGASVVVLDRRLRAVPVGVVGELYLAGPGLARGYHAQSALTAERFVANPFGEPGSRLYRSGDEVRWVRSGTGEGYALEFVGRSDSQVKIRGFRIELGEIDAALQDQDGVNFAATVVHSAPSGAATLVSYVRVDVSRPFDAAAIIEGVAASVPSHMVPAVVMQLEHVPVTAAGKLDRSALPQPLFGSLDHAFRAASTPAEELLATLVAEALGLDGVSVDDSLFAVGGDSIVAMQIAARAKAHGLGFTARTVFEHKTIAAIARAAVRVEAQAPIALAELDGGGIGTIPLTPIMHTMLERGSFADFSQALLLTAPTDVDPDRLAATLKAVLDRHDVLRSRFFPDGDTWVFETTSAAAVPAGQLISQVRTDTVPGSPAFNRVVTAESNAAADRLDPENGVMLQLVWLAPTAHGVRGRLLIVAHHLVVDGVSWRVLVPDFAMAWLHLAAGDTPALAAVGTSFRRWAHGMHEAAKRHAYTDELEHWRQVLDGRDPLLGTRPLDAAIDLMHTVERVHIEISPAVTRAVLSQLPDAFGCGVNDGLLAALAIATVEWRRAHGVDHRSVLLTLEGHGREDDAVPGADLARTVGWFTSAFPVRLQVPDVDFPQVFDGGHAAGDLIKAVKEQLARVPSRGVGYGVLRYLDTATGPSLAKLPTPQIGFNYLGRLSGQGLSSDVRELGWMPDPEAPDLSSAGGSGMTAAAAIDINAVVVETADGPRLTASFAYPTGVLRDSDVASLADLWRRALDGLAAHAALPGAGGLTPSDVPLTPVSQQQIERWERQFPTLREIWSLSPLQSGLLHHAALADGALDVYTAQLRIDLADAVDSARLRAAANGLLSHHPSLRTAFVYDGEGTAAQVVVDDVEMLWEEVDLTGSAPAELALVLAEHRTARFDLARPPLMRMLLVRTAPNHHVLALTNHHIILDGWSMPLLVRELLTRYAIGGGSADLPEPPSYRTYLEWMARQDQDESARAWRTALDGLEEPTLLAPQTLVVPHGVPEEIDIALPPTLVEALAAVGQRGITINTTVQAAWGILLSRLLSRNDIVFGATVSGRPPQLTGVENMLGLFINTLPVRVQVDPDETFAQLLTRLQGEQAALLDHHHVGLSDIQSGTGLGTLFDTLSVFESYPVDKTGLAESTDLAGMRVTALDARDATHYPLTLLTIVEPDLRLSLRYQPAAFDREAVTMLAARLTRILETIAEAADTPVGAHELLTVGERNLVVDTWNATAHPVPRTTLADLLDAQTARTPEAPAITFDGETLSYGTFDARVNQLARHLIGVGVGPETRVGIAVRRSVDLLLAIHAVIKAGGAYVPIDPDQPADRIEHVVATANPVLILTTTVNHPGLPASARTVPLDTLDLSSHSTDSVTDRDRLAPLHPHNPAYLLFTSGSTGRPKGVAVPHAGIVNRLLWMQDRYPLNHGDVVLHKTPVTFDVSVWELFWPLHTGARLVIAEPDGHRDPVYLERIVRDETVTTIHFVPSMLDVFLTGADLGGCTSLRRIFTSGEALSPGTAARLHNASSVELHNLYGPTEASIDVTAYQTRPSESVVPIGAPIWNTTTYVLDARLRPVPVGVVGELYLGGVQLARGYQGRPDLTAERFVANPFNKAGADTAAGTRLYRTGDRVRWLPTGQLEYLGRTDFQVKLRGQRIELGEIEAALLSHPGVVQAVAVVRNDAATGDYLAGYVVCLPGTVADERPVLDTAAAQLPGYMVPSAVVVLAELPVNTNGKLDRKALPIPEFAGSAEFVPPTTPTEYTLAEIYGQILGASRVGVSDSFFDLGGNSLVATRVLARINTKFGVAVSVRELFEHPTVGALAGVVDRIHTDGPRPTLEAAPRPQRLPLSPAQARMWFLNRFDPGSGAYNVAAALRLSGTLDVDALRHAVADIVERHETLRTLYPDTPDGPHQQILPLAAIDHDLIDIASDKVAATELAARVRSVVAQGFDVTTQIPVAVTLLPCEDPAEHVLVMVVHHISIDGWSIQVLARDLVQSYSARRGGDAPAWTPLPIQYADYALWKRTLLGQEEDPASLASRQIDYWRTALAGSPAVLDLPSDRRRLPMPSFQGGSVHFDIASGTYAAVSDLAHTTNATPFMVLHTALAVLLARLSGTDDITIGTPVAGRGEHALDDVVGMFVNTLVLRTVVHPDVTFGELLASTRATDLSAYAHADVPFERIVEVTDTPRSTAHHPLFQTVLALDTTALHSIALPGLQISEQSIDFGIANFDLQLVVTEGVDEHGTAGARATLTYARDLFDHATAVTFADRYTRILQAAVAEPTTPVGDIDILDRTERADLVRQPTSVAVRTLPDLLTDAAHHRDAAALADAGDRYRELTYGELDRRSNALARLLIARGAGPETFVAVSVQRSVESVVAFWAVAKTGAAFVPVDPTYPAERIEHMLRDSGVASGITTSAHRDHLPDTVAWVVLDTPSTLDAIAGQPDRTLTNEDRLAPLSPENPAYLIYTSGSTGTPKGVVVPHSGLAAFVAEQQRHYQIRPGARTLHFASPSFDASILELLMASGGAATMVIVPVDIYGGTELAAILRDAQLTHMFLTPGALATIEPEGLDRIGVVVVGGEACEASLVHRWAPGRKMFNAYGPTESTIMATHHGPMAAGDPVLIGTPVHGTEVLVLDARLHPVPTGVAGELYLRGQGLARGYHDRPGLTAERFVADPFGSSGTRLYRTGDLVRRTASHALEYLGRADAQVKVRGHRIELAEIDAALTAHVNVQSAVTVTHPGTGTLVSYVVGRGSQPVDPPTLITHAARLLPDYMVPSAITVLVALPLTPAGKVDVRALPEPTFAVREFVAPRSVSESRVAQVFADILGLDRVGLDDDFFALGGNSLTATRVIARLNTTAGTALAVRELFEASTVAALAARLDAAERGPTRPVLMAGERPERVPLSLAQQRMWFFNQFDPESSAFNIPVAIRLTGALNVAALRAAVVDVLSRHEALRTVFPNFDHGPAQVIVPVSQVPVDLDPRPVTPQQAYDQVAQLAGRGFDVTVEVPVRVQLLQLGAAEFVLVMVVHHISGDGGSTAPLARDLVVAYAARRAGHEPGWAPLPVQYADYALWQQQVLGTEDDPQSVLSRQLAYWTEELADLPDLVELPTDHPRPAVQSPRGATVNFTLSADLAERIDRLAREHQATFFMVAHTALAVLLARLSGTEDIPIGTQIAGRGEQALDDLVGMFGNTLVLRTRIDGAASFADVLTQVREVDLAGFGHPDVPVERLVEILNPTRSTAYSALFQVLLVVHNYAESRVSLPDLQIDPIDTGTVGAKLDLELNLSERFDPDGRRSGIDGALTYALDLFEDSTVAGFGAIFTTILEAATTEPAVPVGAIELRSEAERRAVDGWNATAVPAPDATLVEVFEAQVARTPDAVAVVFDDTALTYAQFATRVHRLARYLIAQGVGPESVVGLAMSRSVEMMVGLYAVLAAGGGYLPIDPEHPTDRTAYVLATAAPVLVLTSTADRGALPAGVDAVAVDALDVSGYSAAAVTDTDRRAPLRPENLAYAIFTSGSTGRPKGVAVDHRSVVNQMAWMDERYRLGANDTVLQKTPITFDASVWELFYPLQVGARLVVAVPGGHRDPEYLVRAAERWQVTILEFVPSMLALFLAADSALTLPVSLRYVSVGGEALSTDLAARFADRTDAILDNTYGPTETTVTATVFRCPPQPVPGPIPIGTPIRNTRAHVLDHRLRPVPVGVPGELYLAGVQVARGYLGRPDLTADRFVAHPLAGVGQRLYRTGDLVRWNRDGNLEYLGRTDFQVKLRGLRIELGEIESALVAQEPIAQAVVIVHDGDFGQQLVGYVVPAAGHTIEIDTARTAVGQSLPRYMVPDVLTVLDVLPLNGSGKLDRKALPAPQPAAREFRAPTNPVEETVAAVFADVLGLDRVGLDDDFFALGGNSLIATQVISRLGAALDTRMPVRVIFEASTVHALAVRAEQHAGAGGRHALTRRERPEHVPLSLAQQRMWFLNQFDPDSTAYNIPFVVRLSGELDVAALQAAVRDVFARHEALRTVFPDSDLGPAQKIVPASEVPVDLTPVPVTGEDELRNRAATLMTQGFDVTESVPIRGALFRLAESEHVLTVVVHHICADGFSTGPMARDVMVAYAARHGGHEPGWAPLPVQYADYTLWQREVLGSENDPGSLLSQQIEYWIDALAGLPDVLALPTDRPRPAVRSGIGSGVEFTVSATTVERLQSLAREQGATPFMVAHAALAVLLAKLSGTTDIAVGSPIAGRGEAALDDLVGMFVNTLVLRADCDPNLSFTELVEQVRDTDLEAFARADVPFERVVEKLNPTRSQSFSPLFQVMLAFQNYTQSEVELAGLTVSPVAAEWAAAQFDLSMTLGEPAGAGGAYVGTLAYATDIFDAATAQQIAERFVRVLEAVADNPSVPVGDISIVDEIERHRTLAEWNATEHEVPDLLLLDGFDSQVARMPDAAALAFEGESLTYAEFDARVNRLARHLISFGVGPESLVAVGMRRSLDLVIGMYAVLRAGGGYVPVDPDQPRERNDYVLDIADPVCVLSTSGDGFVASGHRVVNVDTVDLSAYSSAAVSGSELLAPVRPANTAYVIFTSGSTGRPKGVAVSHRAIVNLLLWMVSEYEFTDFDVVVQKAPITFDVSVWELFLPLAVGARLVVARPDGHRDPEYLLALIEDTGVTVAEFVPSMLGALLADPDVRIPDSLRLVYVGGEELPVEMSARLATKSAARLDNMYGPTEAAVTVTYYRCDERNVLTVPIGEPVWNTTTLVLDQRLHPVPVGVAGELYLAGVQLARGYHGRATLTAERFVAHPFGEPGALMYRTGDLVRWNTQGQLEFLGRTDLQVKLRGLRIELGEIESTLAVQDAVAQAVTVVHESDIGQRLVGYVVPESGRAVDTEAVREAAGRSLPAYMVPDVLMVLDELPLTPSGKLDRKALPAPVWAAREFRAPTTTVEQIVADIFEDALGLDRVGLDDDFFALGGNSLIATGIVARLRSALDTTVPLQWLFSDPTVQALAGRIEVGAEAAAAEGLGPLLPIRESGAGTPLFCIHPIVGLSWCYSGLSQHLDSDMPIYGIQSPSILEERFLPESLEELADRYISEIRTVQPAGPYRLLGWSLGGVIAHAMAVRLQAAGEKVELLAMMDSFAGSTLVDDEQAEEISLREILGGFGVDGTAVGSDPGLDNVTVALAEISGHSLERAEQVVDRLLSTAERNARLMSEYRPDRFDGDLVFFTAAADDPTGTRAMREWGGAVTGTVYEHLVPATHWRMTSPDALAIACPILGDIVGAGTPPDGAAGQPMTAPSRPVPDMR